MKLLTQRRGVAIAGRDAECGRKQRSARIIASRQSFEGTPERTRDGYDLPSPRLARRKAKFIPLEVHVRPSERGDVFEPLAGIKRGQNHAPPFLRRYVQQSLKLIESKRTTIALDRL